MKLVTFGPRGGEQPGVLTDPPAILPLLPVLWDAGIRLTGMRDVLALWPAIRPLIAEALQHDRERISLADVRFGPPIPNPGKVVGVGFNYDHHGERQLRGQPEGRPVLFMKPPSCVTGPHDPIVYPPETDQLDYEVELGVVISRAGHRIRPEDAFMHIAGYVIANDVTARDVAFGAMDKHPLLAQVVRGKSFPTFCPIGQWLLTVDEIVPEEPLRLWLSVNGERHQDALTSDMRVDVPSIIASISATMRLFPGDLILTGTPPGCGVDREPPTFLATGDRVRAGITNLGELDQLVVSEVGDSLGCHPTEKCPR